MVIGAFLLIVESTNTSELLPAIKTELGASPIRSSECCHGYRDDVIPLFYL